MMRDSIDTLRQEMNALKTQSAVQENKLANIEQQLQSKELLLRGICITVLAGIVLWLGQNAIESHSARKASTANESISKTK